jgi:hypothetical protein
MSRKLPEAGTTPPFGKGIVVIPNGGVISLHAAS